MPEKPIKATCVGIADDMFVLRAVDMKPILLPDVLVGHHRSDLNPAATYRVTVFAICI